MVFWSSGTMVASNYATGTTIRIAPLVCEVLDACAAWTTTPVLARRLGIGRPAEVEPLVARLVALGLLQQRGMSRDPRESAMAALAPWNPEAGFFHVFSRDVRFVRPRLYAGAAAVPPSGRRPPAVVKRYRGNPAVRLPPPRTDGEFARVLLARRTWRRFAAAPLTCAELSTLLAFTAGIQLWLEHGKRRLALKTSPSGGARHAIECYVAVTNVDGLRPGLYHYAPDVHALERLRGAVPGRRLRAYVPGSGYFTKAPAMLFFTAVFGRILWRYPYSRAYRAALVEAGHVCQTFCLAATWLGLAPFCVLGLSDSRIEQDLGIDGIGEAVLYAAGVGRRPLRTAWTPVPGERGLSIRPNPHMSGVGLRPTPWLRHSRGP